MWEFWVPVTGGIYDGKGLTLSGAIGGSGGVTLRAGGHLVYAGSQPNTYSFRPFRKAMTARWTFRSS